MSKPVKTMLTILVSLTLVGIIAIITLLYTDSSGAEPNIDDIVKNSFVTEEIMTDLADGNYVKIQFRIVTDSKAALNYLQKGENFQLNNVIIKKLTVLEEENFRSGLGQIEDTIKLELNKLLEEGLVTDVYIIEKVLQ
ncbi:flagellar basal body-associated FliL family protein [Bacillaceae bacterium W0354]